MEYINVIEKPLNFVREGSVGNMPDSRYLTKQNRKLKQAMTANSQIIRLSDTDEIIQATLAHIANLLDIRHAVFWTRTVEESYHFRCHAASTQRLFTALTQYEASPQQSMISWVAQNNISRLFVKDDSQFFVCKSWLQDINFQSVLAIPIHSKNQVNAVLEIYLPYAQIDQEEVELVNMLAVSAETALENSRQIAELQSEAIELATRNKELEAFAHTVAHDLRTPLNWVNGYVELLIKDWDILAENERIEYASATLHGAQMMSNIIDELLLFASLSDIDIVHDKIDMDTVLENARKRLEPMLRQYQATLIIPTGYPEVFGYAPWIEGVWVNYISNAIKYGGKPPRIQIGYTLQDEVVQFWVEDNGYGLTEDQRSKLFIPFGGVSKQHTQSYGLGLSIVQRIVNKLGGEIAVESRVGKGSRFIFSLPRVRGRLTQ